MHDTTSFFAARMAAIGVTDANNAITVYNPEAEFPQPDKYTTPVFIEDNTTGDIEILYYRINGDLISYEQKGDGKTSHINAKTRLYKTRRLKEPKGDMKYTMPHGQETLPWFPPALVEKYNKKEQIPTLILTEGVFKAMCGSIAGLDVVGLPSVTCYKQRNGQLYEDIQLLIEACNVQALVILWDGDCLNISRKDLQVCDELTNRPYMFFNSAKKIAELVRNIDFAKTREKVDVWFAHIKSDALPGRPKGLDDLIIEATKSGNVGRIIEEMTRLNDKSFFFHTANLNNGTARLVKYFRLHDHEAFFDFHRDTIEDREFKYRGSIYRWSDVNDTLELQTPAWAEKIKWVGDEFFLDDNVPGAYGTTRKLLAYKQGQFTKMYGDKFWNYLPHHKAFCNIPDHFKYQQVIETPDGSKYYNRYFPFPHVPVEGTWPHIEKLMQHIFGYGDVQHSNGTIYSAYELGLDYIQQLLINPTQMLPVLCLYSPENNTGKSTLGKLLMHMFGDNAVPIGNSDLQSDFNEMFVDKLLAICEETLLERKRDAERLKAMSTSEKIMVNPKGSKQYSIDYFCKMLFTSNNLRMVYVSRYDERYWIIRVPKLPEGKDDPNLLDKMNAEIPAFCHFLLNRKMHAPKEGRMYFHRSLLKTPIFDDMVKVNEPSEATNLRENLREWFIATPEAKEIRMTLKEIKTEFFTERTNSAWIQEVLKDYIGTDLLRNEAGEAVFERGFYIKYEPYINPETGEEDIREVRKAYRGRPYVFLRENFFPAGEVIYPAEQKQGHKPVILGAMEEDSAVPKVSDQLPF